MHGYYHKKTYVNACKFNIDPMNSQEMWSKSRLPSVLLLKLHKQPSRLEKMRRKEYDELISTGTKLIKFYTKIKCGGCGKFGHNIRIRYFRLKDRIKDTRLQQNVTEMTLVVPQAPMSRPQPSTSQVASPTPPSPTPHDIMLRSPTPKKKKKRDVIMLYA